MDANHPEPIAELIAKLDKAKKLPNGTERERVIKEAEVLFPAAVEELSILGDTIGVFAAQYQNGNVSKKLSVAKAERGSSTAPISSSEVVPPVLLTKSRRETWRDYWNRKKGQVAIVSMIVAAVFFELNRRNIKLLDDFVHDNDLVGEFEDWAQIEEEQRETPVDWRERREE